MTGSRRLLVVLPDYPNRWGGARVDKLTSAAKVMGWEVEVLAAGPERGSPSALPVHRAPDPSLPDAGVRLLRALRRRGAAATASASPEPSPGIDDRPGWQARAQAAANRLWLHDAHTGWVPVAVVVALRLHRRRRFDAVLSSAPPASGLLAALAISRACRIPLVTDFRDPLAGPEEFGYPPVPRITGFVRQWAERQAFRRAEHVTAVSSGLAEGLGRRHGAPCEVVPQGYVAAATAPAPTPPGPTMRLLHAGNADTWFCDLKPLAAAVREVGAHRLLHLTQLGHVFDPDLHALAATSDGLVEVLEAVDLDAARAAIAAADVVVINRNRPGALWITTKLWDYLAAEKPILAIVDPASDVATIVSSARVGWVVPPGDERALTRALEEIHDRWDDGGVRLDPDRDYLARYEAQAVSRRFFALLSGDDG